MLSSGFCHSVETNAGPWLGGFTLWSKSFAKVISEVAYDLSKIGSTTNIAEPSIVAANEIHGLSNRDICILDCNCPLDTLDQA